MIISAGTLSKIRLALGYRLFFHGIVRSRTTLCFSENFIMPFLLCHGAQNLGIFRITTDCAYTHKALYTREEEYLSVFLTK
jgi:hypothetical protein